MSGLTCLQKRRGFSRRRAALHAAGVLTAGVLFAGSAAGPAKAALLTFSPCDGAALSQPFLPWGDPSEYKLAPDGTFAAGGWSLNRGAQIVSAPGPVGSHATVPVLQLGPGSAALSGVSCVDAAYPTVRMFVAGTGAVAVSVVDDGVVLPAGVAIAGGGWMPTLPMLTLSAVRGATSGGTAEVSLLLTGLVGRPLIDDVYIDPWYRG
jgi:hypothetical protein